MIGSSVCPGRGGKGGPRGESSAPARERLDVDWVVLHECRSPCICICIYIYIYIYRSTCM